MKTILVLGRFFDVAGVARVGASATITNFLLSQGTLPVIAACKSEGTSPQAAQELASRYLVGASGVILQGGNDVDPSFYGQQNTASHDCNPSRDIFEKAVVERALAEGKPVFGICRGLQLINVALGGSLHQHLDPTKWQQHFSVNSGHFVEKNLSQIKNVTHTVSVESGGVLQQLLGRQSLSVNSYHHQGIDRLAQGLQVEARSDDGLIEAYSNQSLGLIAVQWHPEEDLISDGHYRTLMTAWLNAIA